MAHLSPLPSPGHCFAIGLKLTQEPGVAVVAEAGDLPATFAALEAHQPNVLLLDMHLPEPVLPALPSLRESAPDGDPRSDGGRGPSAGAQGTGRRRGWL